MVSSLWLLPGPTRTRLLPLRIAVRWCAIFALLLQFTSLHADQLPTPGGDVLLTINGNIRHSNVNDELHLDRAQLESLNTIEITTETFWDEGPQVFTGVTVSELLTLSGATSMSFVAKGIDDYSFTLSDIDFDRYPAIVAFQHNGSDISMRELGPLRLIFPISDYPELRTVQVESGSVWQLVEISVL